MDKAGPLKDDKAVHTSTDSLLKYRSLGAALPNLTISKEPTRQKLPSKGTVVGHSGILIEVRKPG
jgi:hypothetical protein